MHYALKAARQTPWHQHSNCCIGWYARVNHEIVGIVWNPQLCVAPELWCGGYHLLQETCAFRLVSCSDECNAVPQRLDQSYNCRLVMVVFRAKIYRPVRSCGNTCFRIFGNAGYLVFSQRSSRSRGEMPYPELQKKGNWVTNTGQTHNRNDGGSLKPSS